MNNKLIVDERQADLGNFMVGRLLPFRKKRQVGPFTFIDHMGPAEIGAGRYMDVDQHPHIGLSTLTYLYEGSVHHKDSMGTDQVVNAGDVGFMTAGSGVTHTERTPVENRDGLVKKMHGYQIWVAMPKAMEEDDPSFQFVAKADLTKWEQDGNEFILVAGSAFGKNSPLKGHSPLFMVDIHAKNETTIDLKGQVKGEIAFVVVKGEIMEDGERIKAGQMLISKTEDACKICCAAGTQLLLFGGQAFDEERYLLWNFVSSSKERLQQAKQDWMDKKFPKVPGDDTYIPFPVQLK